MLVASGADASPVLGQLQAGTAPGLQWGHGWAPRVSIVPSCCFG